MKWLEISGAVLGMAGSAWIALKWKGFGYAYLLFLSSSLILTAFFVIKRNWWMAAQQVVFAVVNIGGIIVWIM